MPLKTPHFLASRVKHKSLKVRELDSELLVSAEELHMLLEPSPSPETTHAPGWGFKYRNIFLLLCTLWFLLKLLLFPEANYQVLTSTLATELFLPYLQKRGWLHLFWLLIYSWSYAKDWHFQKIALVCFASEVTIFCMDVLVVYSYWSGPFEPLLTFFVLLRLAFIGCLMVNALYAHKAPRLPRALWR